MSKELIERLRDHAYLTDYEPASEAANLIEQLEMNLDSCASECLGLRQLGKDLNDRLAAAQAKVAWLEGTTPNWGGWPWDSPYNDGYETAKAEFRKEILESLHAQDICHQHLLGEMQEQLAAEQAKIAELGKALAESQANDRCGMMYLGQVRAIVGGDDFPDMVKRVEAMQAREAKYREALEMAESAFDECKDYPITHDMIIEALTQTEVK